MCVGLKFKMLSWQSPEPIIMATYSMLICKIRSLFWPDLAAQGDIGEDHGVCVDPIQCVHHGLHSLDPVLLTYGATLPLMDLKRWVGITDAGNRNCCVKTTRLPCLQAAGGGRRTGLLWWCRRGCGSAPFSRCSGRWPLPALWDRASQGQLRGSRSLPGVWPTRSPSACPSSHLLPCSGSLKLRFRWIFADSIGRERGKGLIPEERQRSVKQMSQRKNKISLYFTPRSQFI